MNREQHVAWTKGRALDELDAPGPADRRVSNALASVQSDLRKHPDTSEHAALELGAMLQMGGHLQTEHQVREWIEGFR